MTGTLERSRRWFYAAAIYNIVWGVAVVLSPDTLLRMTGTEAPGALPFVQAIGMMVGVFAYGYYLLGREPERYAKLVWIALAGKTLGPLGFIYSATTGGLPWGFGWICLFNDVIWWPVFWRFAVRYARVSGR